MAVKQDLQKIVQSKKPTTTTTTTTTKRLFKSHRDHFPTSLRITKDEYYKIHFEENTKMKTLWETIKEVMNIKNNSVVYKQFTNQALSGEACYCMCAGPHMQKLLEL